VTAMPTPPTAADINTALLATVTRSRNWLATVLNEVGWCEHLPPWPADTLTAPADIYLLHAHALAIQHTIPQVTCPCHRGWRGALATEAIRRWRILVDYALSCALLAPAGNAEDLHARLREEQAAFRRWASVLVDG